MAGTKRETRFVVRNCLEELINKEAARRQLELGKRVPVGKIQKEIAEFAEVSEVTVQKIKKHFAESVDYIIAYRIAQYFKLPVEKVFWLEEKE